MDLPKNRRACDRCHQQKLSCKRKEGTESCIRCGRANVNCIFSPSKRRRKPESFSTVTSLKTASPRPRSIPFDSPGADTASPPRLNGATDVPNPVLSYPAGADASLLASSYQTISPRLTGHGFGDLPIDMGCGLGGLSSTLYSKEPSELDFGPMLDSSPSEQLEFDLNIFDHGRTPNPMSISTPSLAFDNSYSPADMMFSAESPDTSSFASTASSVFEFGTPRTKSSSVSSQSVMDDVPKPSLQRQAERQSSPFHFNKWVGDRLPCTPPDAGSDQKSQRPSLDMPDWTSKVAELNVDLLRQQEQVMKIDGSDVAGPNDPVFAIDRIFLLTQQLIDLLKQIGRQLSTPHPHDLPSPPRSSTSARSPSHEQSSSSSSTTEPPRLDAGSKLLVISCQTRLLEIYERVFIHAERWILDAKPSSRLDDMRFFGLNIGSQSRGSSSGLQMRLVAQVAELLLDRLCKSMCWLESDGDDDDDDDDDDNDCGMACESMAGQGLGSFNEVADVALRTYKLRGSEIVTRLGRIKGLLMDDDDDDGVY